MFPKSKGNHILIVEDNVALAFSWGRELEERLYQVTYSLDVRSALAACRDSWPDAIILDGFFRDSYQRDGGAGGQTFCSEISQLLEQTGRELPFILGVSGAINCGAAGDEVFSHVPQSLMPVRKQKPVSAAELADELDHAILSGQMKDPCQIDFAF